MVFDVPAESGGALTILNQYYQAAMEEKDTEWIFVISTPLLKEQENIKVLRFPWIKKSWFHRFFFDKFISSKLVDKYGPDEVLSLQNVIIPNVIQKQTLYLHQALPFTEKRYRVTENFKFWLYQNVISKMVFNSIKKADSVVVQTKWIRDAAIEKTGTDKDKFILKQPDLNIKIDKLYEQENRHKKIFFYPASGLEYKNHTIIIEALEKLDFEYKEKVEIIFTLDKDENPLVHGLYQRTVKNSLPIKFIGMISINEIFNYYSKSTLIFPSYVESFGLPLLEAKLHECPIIASDCAFSREILDGYGNVKFFDPFDKDELVNLLK